MKLPYIHKESSCLTSDQIKEIARFSDISFESLENDEPSWSFYCFDSKPILADNKDIKTELKRKLKKNKVSVLEDIPFMGGWVGFLSYDYINDLYKNKKYNFDTLINRFPRIYFTWIDTLIAIKHDTQSIYFIAQTENENRNLVDFINKIKKFKIKSTKNKSIFEISKHRFLWNESEYKKNISKAKKMIYEGNIYQVNLSYPIKANYKGDVFEFYKKLKKKSPSPYGVYMKTPHTTLMSVSPEQFFKVKNSIITTRPIKGTSARHEDSSLDETFKEELLNSEKDKAELLMITDLSRHDLGELCKTGTVKVPKIREIESYANVHQAVSTIEGELKDNVDAVDALFSLFPGGSITGAPKLAAMKAIHELESHPRNIYTGSIGYLSINGNAEFNIAIRTAYTIDDTIYYHTGAGIVADSDPEKEWQETLVKAKAFTETVAELI